MQSVGEFVAVLLLLFVNLSQAFDPTPPPLQLIVAYGNYSIDYKLEINVSIEYVFVYKESDVCNYFINSITYYL